MSVLTESGVDVVFHYTPLHYLPFIARSSALLSKPSLTKEGFVESHLRSKSCKHDVARGFGRYAFLTLDNQARILRAKLNAGFPHIGVGAPAETVEKTKFSLSRYNVAMTRYLRRGNTPGFAESETNGRYYGKQQIPVAFAQADKRALLKKHLNSGTMIEVLIDGDLGLTDETTIICFSEADKKIASKVLDALGKPWKISIEQPPGPYRRSKVYASEVEKFVERALADAGWRGNGLEFDRV